MSNSAGFRGHVLVTFAYAAGAVDFRLSVATNLSQTFRKPFANHPRLQSDTLQKYCPPA